MSEQDHTNNPDAPARYVQDDGLVVWRASALGGCERRLVAAARGEEASPHPQWSIKPAG